MRYTLILAIAMLMFGKAFAIPADELSKNAKYIKANFADDYERTIKKNALNKWGDDFSMVIYMINKQSDALVELVETFRSDNTKIFFNAMFKWTIDGWEENNKKQAEELKDMSLANMMKFNCDWSMVLYEYKKQVKAKNAF